MSELEPNVKFQHNDDEPPLAPAPENVISAHLHFQNLLRRPDIFIFLLHFHSAFVYFRIIWYLFFIVLLHFTINNHLVPVLPRQQSSFPLVFVLSLPVAAPFPLPISFSCPAFILASLFSPRSSPFPLASASHVGIHTKPNHSTAPHHTPAPTIICFVLSMASAV